MIHRSLSHQHILLNITLEAVHSVFAVPITSDICNLIKQLPRPYLLQENLMPSIPLWYPENAAEQRGNIQGK